MSKVMRATVDGAETTLERVSSSPEGFTWFDTYRLGTGVEFSMYRDHFHVLAGLGKLTAEGVPVVVLEGGEPEGSQEEFAALVKLNDLTDRMREERAADTRVVGERDLVRLVACGSFLSFLARLKAADETEDAAQALSDLWVRRYLVGQGYSWLADADAVAVQLRLVGRERFCELWDAHAREEVEAFLPDVRGDEGLEFPQGAQIYDTFMGEPGEAESPAKEGP